MAWRLRRRARLIALLSGALALIVLGATWELWGDGFAGFGLGFYLFPAISVLTVLLGSLFLGDGREGDGTAGRRT